MHIVPVTWIKIKTRWPNEIWAAYEGISATRIGPFICFGSRFNASYHFIHLLYRVHHNATYESKVMIRDHYSGVWPCVLKLNRAKYIKFFPSRRSSVWKRATFSAHMYLRGASRAQAKLSPPSLAVGSHQVPAPPTERIRVSECCWWWWWKWRKGERKSVGVNVDNLLLCINNGGSTIPNGPISGVSSWKCTRDSAYTWESCVLRVSLERHCSPSLLIHLFRGVFWAKINFSARVG